MNVHPEGMDTATAGDEVELASLEVAAKTAVRL
jgi:hypothetical protein